MHWLTRIPRALRAAIREVRIERKIRRAIRRHRGLNEEMLFLSEELFDEIKEKCPDDESKIQYCLSEIDGTWWGNNVLLGCFGDEIFAEALRRKYAAA